MERYSLDGVINTICEMGSNEKVHLNEYLGNVVLEITKDPDYDDNRNRVVFDSLGADVMNLVTVDFLVGGKSIASTCDIHVDELEDVLNDIRDGATNCLIDEDKPLAEIVKAAERNAKSVDRD